MAKEPARVWGTIASRTTSVSWRERKKWADAAQRTTTPQRTRTPTQRTAPLPSAASSSTPACPSSPSAASAACISGGCIRRHPRRSTAAQRFPAGRQRQEAPLREHRQGSTAPQGPRLASGAAGRRPRACALAAQALRRGLRSRHIVSSAARATSALHARGRPPVADGARAAGAKVPPSAAPKRCPPLCPRPRRGGGDGSARG